MRRIQSVEELRREVSKAKTAGSVGFVPTMGYLHEGHLSLVRRAREECDFVVVSVFVNPAQFGPGEDLEAYPRDVERDSALLEEAGVDVLFVPAAEDVYMEGFSTWVEVKGLDEHLCGRRRPGHFQGVATVVLKLFNMVEPDRAYFGEKDYQQLKIIQRMVRDLNVPVEVVGCPIVREPDGLAMSSRNSYLSREGREKAATLYRSLEAAARAVESGVSEAGAVREEALKVFEETPGVEVDYFEVCDPETLRPVEKVERPVLLAVAAYVEKARLIDNRIV